MSFKKFLQKNVKQAEWRKYPYWGNQRMISVEALGEWAFNEVERIRDKWFPIKGKEWVHLRTVDLQRIAIDCLGQKEVLKKIEKFSRNKKKRDKK